MYSDDSYMRFFMETPNCIPTETSVSSDLALLAKRSSSRAIESCKIIGDNIMIVHKMRHRYKYVYENKTNKRLDANLFKDTNDCTSTEREITKL